MEERIKDAFSLVAMDEECADKIRESLANPKKQISPARRFVQATAAVAACLLLVLFVIGNGNIVKAVDHIVYYCEQTLKNMRISDMEDQYIFGNGLAAVGRQKVTRSDGTEYYFTASTSAEWWGPYWLEFEYEQSRVFFVGDGSGERIEITDQISETKIFTTQFTDEYGITHYVAVNGVYNHDHAPYRSVNWFEFYMIGYEETPDDTLDDMLSLRTNGTHNEEDGSVREWFPEAIKLLDLERITKTAKPYSDFWKEAIEPLY